MPQTAKAAPTTGFAAKERQEKYDPRIPCRTIHVDGFKGVKLQVLKDPVRGWLIHTIAFNPGSVSNGHNGRVLNVEQFLHAASTLIELVTPLLVNPDEGIHILPGLHAHSRAWWKSIEIPFHVLDEDGAILRAYGGAKHPEIHSTPLYKRNGQSLCFTNSTGHLLIRVYRKDVQMKQNATTAQPVLRIELFLDDDKLKQHLPHGVWKTVDGAGRLVSFRACDLRAAHLEVMSKFDGAYARIPSVLGEDDCKIGRMMGFSSFREGPSLDEQFDYHEKRFLSGNTPAAIRNAKSRLLKGARKELALLTPVKLCTLFSEDAWHGQPVVTSPKIETMTQARHRGISVNPLVEAAYGCSASTIA